MARPFLLVNNTKLAAIEKHRIPVLPHVIDKQLFNTFNYGHIYNSYLFFSFCLYMDDCIIYIINLMFIAY